MTDQRALKTIINQQREQIKELTAKLVEALSDADKRIGIHKQEFEDCQEMLANITYENDIKGEKLFEANRILKDLIIQFDFGGAREDQLILVKDLHKVLAFNKPKQTEVSK